jgi:hypothetical protein
MNDYQLEDMLDAQSRALRDSRSSGAVPGRPANPAGSSEKPGRAGGSEAQPWADPAGLGDIALTLAPLLLLAQEIAAMLLPLAPRAEYRHALHRSLIKQARRQQALGLLDLPEPIRSPFVPEAQPLPNRVAGWITQETASLDVDRRWVLGAAAVGSAVSLAGILAYVLSHRGRPAASA